MDISFESIVWFTFHWLCTLYVDLWYTLS